MNKPAKPGKYVVKISFADKNDAASEGSFTQVLKWLEFMELINPNRTIVSVTINRIIGESVFRRRSAKPD